MQKKSIYLLVSLLLIQFLAGCTSPTPLGVLPTVGATGIPENTLLPEPGTIISPENADELTPFLLWDARITAASWLPGMNSIGISTISDAGEYGVYVLDVNELLFTQYIQDASGAIVFSPDGNLMASEDGVINLWEINTGEKLRSYGGNAERWVAFHSATSILLVESFPPSFEKSHIGLWNIKNGEHTDILEINGITRNVSYNHSLSFLVLSIVEKPDQYRVVVWDINLQKQICDIPDALSAEFDEANDLLVVTDGKEFSFWDARKCEIKRKIKTEFVPLYRFAISPVTCLEKYTQVK
jgi:WD40 repeat protein